MLLDQTLDLGFDRSRQWFYGTQRYERVEVSGTYFAAKRVEDLLHSNKNMAHHVWRPLWKFKERIQIEIEIQYEIQRESQKETTSGFTRKAFGRGSEKAGPVRLCVVWRLKSRRIFNLDVYGIL